VQSFKALNLNLVHGYHIPGRGFSDSWVVSPGVRAKGNCDAIDITEEGHAFIHFDGQSKWIPMSNIKGATPAKEEAKPLTDSDAKAAPVTAPAKVAALLVGSPDKSAQGDANKPAPKVAAKKPEPTATAGA
jgi:hypothetical protein